MKALLLYVLVLACSQPKEQAPAFVCPPAPVCSASVVYIDLEAERFKRDYDFRTGKKKAKAICSWSHWAFINQVEWCEAKATEFDCGYDSWMDAWPGGKPWSAEGNFKSIGACCFDDPESKFDCAYMKERARICDELIGQTHKVTCHTVFCEDKRKICL